MRILLTGGTGLIGRALCRLWHDQGHELVVWSRDPAKVTTLCPGARPLARLDDLDPATPIDAVVNLAGAPIADRPWTDARRAALWKSRVDLTRTLVDWIARRPVPPRVLVSGSATGLYGDRGDETLDEDSAPRPTDFGARLCAAWEHEASRASAHGVRVALVRTAPVLAPDGGLLPRLRIPFALGLGGRLGSGRQWMPWIHLDDEVALIDRLLHDAAAHGPFLACAPEAVRNAGFTRALSDALHRPAFLVAPAWALRLALGEMAVLLLGGQRLVPRRTAATGFVWRHPALAPALVALEAARSQPGRADPGHADAAAAGVARSSGTTDSSFRPTRPADARMTLRDLLPSALIGAVASARSMTPMASLALARIVRRRTPGPLALLDRPVFKAGALAMGVGELFGDKMKTAPDRTVALGLLARVSSAGIAGAALAPEGRAPLGAAVAVAAAVPLAYATLAARERAMDRIGQTKSGLIEDALVVAAGLAIVLWATRPARR